MNRVPVIILLLAVSVALILPAALFVQTVNAQSNYTIQNVNQTVEVMYSGQTVISYVISVNGTLPSDFQVGLPSNFSADVIKGYAYDSQNNTYQVELGTQLGSQSGFYAAQIDLNGKSPQVLTLVLIVSNSLLSQSSDVYTLSYPAYPGLTQTAAACSVTFELPVSTTSISITKSDGDVNSLSYSPPTTSLAAFTNEEAVATFNLTSAYIQNMDITQLSRQVTVNPTGTVTAIDTYNIENTSPSSLSTFVFDLPSQASSVTITDSSGNTLTTSDLNATANSIQILATLSSDVASAQSTVLIAQYTLPSATIQGTTYTATFNQFPSTNYYIDTATLTFTSPEGATISSASPDSSISIERTNYQESITSTQQGISFVNYNLPGATTLQVKFDYNTVWVSFRPVIIILVLAVIICIGIIIWKKYQV